MIISKKSGSLMLLALIINSLLFTSVTRAGTVADVDGNIYKTVTVGDQEWMADNVPKED